jgi:diguanylate cyclase (GGDEF)-like protein
MRRENSEEVTIITKSDPYDDGPIIKVNPSEKASAHLIVLSGANVGQVYNLTKTKIVIGRDENADIQILDAGISRHHARISWDSHKEGYKLEDAGSLNGTYANNQRVYEPYFLREGDKIQLGSMTVLKFACSNELETHYAQKMYETAHRDGLIGIFNRRYFDEQCKSHFLAAVRHQQALSLLVLDLDDFKKINDTYGHPVGDQILIEVANLIGKNIRSDDILARYGGEEFVVLCGHTNLLKASILGERIRHAVSHHVFLSATHHLHLTISIGLASLPDPEITTFEEFIAAADSALYKAKHRGRNCVCARRL